jgi:hypothetical protein
MFQSCHQSQEAHSPHSKGFCIDFWDSSFWLEQDSWRLYRTLYDMCTMMNFYSKGVCHTLALPFALKKYS